MTTLLRTRLDELEVYVTRVAEATGIPPAHLEKDFWVTEVLRGASSASEATGCSVFFKGGTSLSKAHRIIRRFSEDVDLVVALPEGGKGAKDSTLKTFVAAAESTTGVEGTVDPSSATKGVKSSPAAASVGSNSTLSWRLAPSAANSRGCRACRLTATTPNRVRRGQQGLLPVPSPPLGALWIDLFTAVSGRSRPTMRS